MITVQDVNNKQQRKDFMNLPDAIYANYPNYVPLLKVDLKDFMKPSHPFYQHGEAQFFIAYQDNKPVGRVCAYINKQYNNYHQQQIGFFGSFECINDQQVAKALLETAKQWLLERGIHHMRGPIDYYSNEPQGCLVDGFDSYPPVPLAYHPNYYQQFFETFGFTKQADLYAYQLDDFARQVPMNKGQMFVDRVTKRHGITFRPLNMRKLNKDISQAVDLFNEFEKINGENFMPIDQSEAEHFAKQMKPIIDPNLTYFAEKDGKPIGFICAIPDVNELLIKVKHGKLFPSGIFKLLTLKFKKFGRLRIMLLGMLDEYQKIGLGPALCYKVLPYAEQKGYKQLDMSMIHEDNTFMLNLSKRLGGDIYKTYRVYQSDIA